MTNRLLWTLDAMTAAMRARPQGALPAEVGGISIDTRTIAPGEAFFAIQGENRDGHDFVAAALKARAGLAVVAADKRAAMPNDAPLLVVPDVLDGLRDLARAARARLGGKVVGVTGSVGKTGTKEALRLALSARRRDACLGRVLQQSLGRSALARALPAERALRRVRDGHEPCRRDRAAHAARAPTRCHHHRDRAGASRILPVGRGDRRRQGRDLSRAGSRAAAR